MIFQKKGIKTKYFAYKYILIKCGHCSECLKAKISEDTNRCLVELKKNKGGLFITLTYTDEFLSYTKKGNMTLVKKDIQDFFKRLKITIVRKFGKNISYIYSGEYGMKLTDNKRPHYHALLFVDIPPNKLLDIVHEKWNFGYVTGEVLSSCRAINYVCSTHICGLSPFVSFAQKHNILDDQFPPFTRKSNGFGLPNDEKLMEDMVNNNIVSESGVRFRMSRYQREKCVKKVIDLSSRRKQSEDLQLKIDNRKYEKDRFTNLFVKKFKKR